MKEKWEPSPGPVVASFWKRSGDGGPLFRGSPPAQTAGSTKKEEKNSDLMVLQVWCKPQWWKSKGNVCYMNPATARNSSLVHWTHIASHSCFSSLGAVTQKSEKCHWRCGCLHLCAGLSGCQKHKITRGGRWIIFHCPNNATRCCSWEGYERDELPSTVFCSECEGHRKCWVQAHTSKSQIHSKMMVFKPSRAPGVSISLNELNSQEQWALDWKV